MYKTIVFFIFLFGYFSTGFSQQKTEVDKIIDSYDTCMTKYIKLYKKIQAGDTATVEMQKLVQEFQEIGSKLSSKVSEFTPEQTQRLTDIVKKAQTMMTNTDEAPKEPKGEEISVRETYSTRDFLNRVFRKAYKAKEWFYFGNPAITIPAIIFFEVIY